MHDLFSLASSGAAESGADIAKDIRADQRLANATAVGVGRSSTFGDVFQTLQIAPAADESLAGNVPPGDVEDPDLTPDMSDAEPGQTGDIAAPNTPGAERRDGGDTAAQIAPDVDQTNDPFRPGAEDPEGSATPQPSAHQRDAYAVAPPPDRRDWQTVLTLPKAAPEAAGPAVIRPAWQDISATSAPRSMPAAGADPLLVQDARGSNGSIAAADQVVAHSGANPFTEKERSTHPAARPMRQNADLAQSQWSTGVPPRAPAHPVEGPGSGLTADPPGMVRPADGHEMRLGPAAAQRSQPAPTSHPHRTPIPTGAHPLDGGLLRVDPAASDPARPSVAPTRGANPPAGPVPDAPVHPVPQHSAALMTPGSHNPRQPQSDWGARPDIARGDGATTHGTSAGPQAGLPAPPNTMSPTMSPIMSPASVESSAMTDRPAGAAQTVSARTEPAPITASVDPSVPLDVRQTAPTAQANIPPHPGGADGGKPAEVVGEGDQDRVSLARADLGLADAGERPMSGAMPNSATATRFDAAMARPDLPRHIAGQLAPSIVQLPGQSVEVALNPEELGRVRLTVSLSDNAVTVLVAGERAETLDLMRRHADDLLDALREAGLSDLSLAFSDDPRSQSQSHSQAGAASESADPDRTGSGADLPEHPHLTRPSPATTAGLDIRL